MSQPETVIKITFDRKSYTIWAPLKYLPYHRLRPVEPDGTGFFGSADTLEEAQTLANLAFRSILSQKAMERDFRSFHEVSEADRGHLGEWTEQDT